MSHRRQGIGQFCGSGTSTGSGIPTGSMSTTSFMASVLMAFRVSQSEPAVPRIAPGKRFPGDLMYLTTPGEPAQ